MVARISSGSSPAGAARYNEDKVEKGEAERLAIRNFRGSLVPVEEHSLTTIAAKLEQQADLNDRVSKPTFHVSLSLSIGENPGKDELVAIADRYMQGMGYGRQPYVIYQHKDTEHAHIHILSVRVDDKGKKISDQFEKQKSNSLRKEIEKEFGLQVAERASLRNRPDQLQPIEYGKGDLKREIGEVVNGILRDFKFSSFSQFNQILSLYNIRAVETPTGDKKPGLIYSAIDAQKVAVGAAFRASSLPYQPTLDRVNRRAEAGKKIKGDRAPALKRSAKGALESSKNWNEFQQRLSRAGIEVLPHLGKEGNLFGISFVDVKTKGIYTGSELGKSFTAGALKETLGEAYSAPSMREVAPTDKPDQDLAKSQKQTLRETNQNNLPAHEKTETPMQNLNTVQQLLFALGQEDTGQEGDYELKKMIKKSRPKSR